MVDLITPVLLRSTLNEFCDAPNQQCDDGDDENHAGPDAGLKDIDDQLATRQAQGRERDQDS